LDPSILPTTGGYVSFEIKPTSMKTSHAFILVGAIVLVVYTCGRSSGDIEENEVYTPDRIDAFVMAKQLMESRLKAPRTAEFASISDSNIRNLGGNEWEVSSYVDSQNSFGAMIRTRFTITMTVNIETKYWQATKLVTDP
jgi:hypothetical protein